MQQGNISPPDPNRPVMVVGVVDYGRQWAIIDSVQTDTTEKGAKRVRRG